MKPLHLLVPVLLALCLGACRERPARFPVAQVQLTGATLVDNSLLGLGREQVQHQLLEVLERTERFELPDAKRALHTSPPWKLTLEVPFTREAQRESSPGTYAEVGASLVLEQSGSDGAPRYEVVGLGEMPVSSQAGPDARREALRAALASALVQVAEAAVLQLSAVERPNDALVKDLQAGDPRVREFALRVLADRRQPQAAPLLIERLQDGDPLAVRRAIGALVEMRTPEAVSALIELSRGKDLGFQQEILFALGEIGGDEAEAYLYTVSQGHDQASVRAAARDALDSLHTARKLHSGARGEGRAAQRNPPR
ncbi:HEAT repeat domain-containing protein [Aggregicoccus sp. 17bor-14]|uniref:HEAT repeat domain-containing protein n=1 Tax=Myxococcaceae TaxID=31 RepID=UPI00129C47F6|nr:MULTISPECIES: HEAT repeat domain-containing protein [Myxococcaceae]MBF5044115.1 HEAT repeat domain-containing protein [Simulacricoccus sp. 17bor-14]MRI89865.1 HEAT repeat domain-containing protein [Aggregicoccus sp. 17bor-14]